MIVHDAATFTQEGYPARVLYDPDNAVRDVPVSAEEIQGDPYYPEDQVKLFLYFMGATVTVIQRGEWIAAARGAASFRDDLLIPLMLAESGVHKADGAKRLNRYLTDEQMAALAAIPAIGSDPQQLLAAHTAIAREYLTRSRRLATLLSTEWPAQLEQASRELWRRVLDIDLDTGC